MRAKAAAHGRKIRFGIRLHVIVRETNDEAWQAAERLISHLDDETIAKAQAAFARTDSVGQQRMAALHNGKRDNLEISPNLWAGVGLVRGGAGTALVGDGPTVAARINEYPGSSRTGEHCARAGCGRRIYPGPACCCGTGVHRCSFADAKKNIW